MHLFTKFSYTEQVSLEYPMVIPLLFDGWDIGNCLGDLCAVKGFC
jgi:hypothetical protein